jgi:hypothetical protein
MRLWLAGFSVGFLARQHPHSVVIQDLQKLHPQTQKQVLKLAVACFSPYETWPDQLSHQHQTREGLWPDKMIRVNKLFLLQERLQAARWRIFATLIGEDAAACIYAIPLCMPLTFCLIPLKRRHVILETG